MVRKIGRLIGKIAWPIKLGVFILILVGGGLGWNRIAAANKNKTTYETATVEKGTLISTISGTGTIASGNYINVTTKASGKVKQVYVTNGETVIKGQKLAEVSLDDYALERQTTAWTDYLHAQEGVKTVQKQKAEADVQMWKDRQAIFTALDNIDYKNNNTTNPATKKDYTESEKIIIDKTADAARASLAESELKYKNADAEIASAYAKATAALRDYQENSAVIVAPAGGVIRDLNLAAGITIAASTTTSNSSGATIVSAQTVGKISDPNGQLIASVNLSETDIIKVKANQKVTLTLDAYADKTFTGKVLSVDTSGTSSSGVTSYGVKILLDQTEVEIYPNMAVNVEIITEVKADVLMIPTTAISINSGQGRVQVKSGDKISTVEVTTGSANDTMTEVTSGLKEGETVVTATIQNTATTQTTTTSPFSGLGRTSTTNRSGSGFSSTRGAGQVFQGGPPGGF